MITHALLREWSACWLDESITRHAAGRSQMSPREIAARAYAIDSAALVSHLAGRPEDQAEHARLVGELRRIYAIPPGPQRNAELAAWDAARDAGDATLRKAIARALDALGPDADGWRLAA